LTCRRMSVFWRSVLPPSSGQECTLGVPYVVLRLGKSQ
jgi:hypothetical protein